jgi:diguanylate cyclase (GGDEF)-like protein
LIIFSDVLKSCAGEDKIAVRYGGDEFLIVGQVEDKEEAEAFKAKLETVLGEANAQSGLPYQIEASIGYVLTNPKSKAELDDYVEEADELMYEVKKRNRKNRQSYSAQ